jgi:hypothetical protein
MNDEGDIYAISYFVLKRRIALESEQINQGRKNLLTFHAIQVRDGSGAKVLQQSISKHAIEGSMQEVI